MMIFLEYIKSRKYDDVIMLLDYFKRMLIEDLWLDGTVNLIIFSRWLQCCHTDSKRDVSGCFSWGPLSVGFCWVISEVLAYVFGFRMTYSLLPPEQLLYCVPGSNASCVMIAILGNSLVILSTCHFKPLLGPTNVLTTSFCPVAAHVSNRWCWCHDGEWGKKNWG